MIRPEEGTVAYWDDQAGTLDDARFATWAVVEDEWDETTDSCLAVLAMEAPIAAGDRGVVLDVGCGVGRLAIPLAGGWRGADVIGVDFSQAMIDHARKVAVEVDVPNVQFRCVDAGKLVGIPGQVDYAYSVAVLQHQQDDKAAAIVASVAQVLRPGGRFVFQVTDDRPWDEWIYDAGLTLVDARHAVFPTWTWIIADKPT